MKTIASQFRTALKCLSELYRSDPALAGAIHRSASGALYLVGLAPGNPAVIDSIEWPAETPASHKPHASLEENTP